MPTGTRRMQELRIEARTVSCPECFAAINQQCYAVKSGNPRRTTTTHIKRINRYLALRRSDSSVKPPDN